MIGRLIQAALNSRLLIVVLAVLVMAAGWHSYQKLPIDAFPDVSPNLVQVFTETEGLAPEEIEKYVTYPVESAMNGLPGIKNIRSVSNFGLSVVNVYFEDGMDIYFARQLVNERLQEARQQIPEGFGDPQMGPISTGMGLVLFYYLEDETGKRSLEELRTIQDWLVKFHLQTVPGVTEVLGIGGWEKQFHVVVDPNALLRYGVTVNEVIDTIKANNLNVGAQFIEKNAEEYIVRSVGLASSIEDIEDIVIKSVDGTPIFLKQLADIRVGGAIRRGVQTRNGMEEVVSGQVIKLFGTNSSTVISRVEERMQEINKILPGGIRLIPYYEQKTLVKACVGTVTSALIQGVWMVAVILIAFLGSFRPSLVTALSIPFSILFAMIWMRYFGISANLMSFGGLAIAIGMVADGAIVVVENIVSMMRDPANRDLTRTEVALRATREVARPVFFSILVIVAVMLPLFSLQEIEGKMFKPMALTMVFAMGGSLLVALTLVPALSAWFSSRRPEPAGGNPVVRLLAAGYRPTLRLAGRFRWPVALFSVAALAATITLIPRLGTEFLPPLDEGALAVNVVRLPTASLDASRRQATVLEQMILEEYPEVETVVSKTGRAEIAEDPMGPEQSDLLIMLKPRDQWRPDMTREKLVTDMAVLFDKMPGIRPSFSQPIALRVNELISGIKSDVAIRIFGDDLDKLRETAEQIAPLLANIPGAEDVKVEQVSGMQQMVITPHPDKLSRHGLNTGDIGRLVETAVGGTLVGDLYEGQRWFGIRVRLPEVERDSAAAIERIPLEAPSGSRLFLGDVAAVDEVEAPAQVSRDNSRRRLMIECNVRGRDLGSFIASAKEKLVPLEKELPSGYRLTWGGQFENQERATRRLAVVVPVALLLILLMQLSALGNIRSALLVILNLPFSLVGGIWTIWLMDMNISVSVLVGLIVLLGMAVQHGTILVSFIDELRRRGMGIAEAVEEASIRRLRPLLMTKLTSLLGLVPMVLSAGPGSDIQRPLAAVVLGGLLFTTLLNMYVVPALYGWFHRE